MLGALALQVVCSAVAAWLAAGWWTAAVCDTLVAAYLAALTLRPTWRPLLARLMVIGLVAGVLELGTDFAGQRVAHSLVYPAAEPALWASPIYMPLSWMVVLTQLGYLAWRLGGLAPRPLPRWAGGALVALWGAINIPFYEEMAYHAGWWRYRPVLPLGHTPLYVLLFEGLVAAALPLVIARLARAPWRAVVFRGIVVGLWMPWAALFAWLVLGR